MAFFENFTASIRDKWLEYFQVNRPWLSIQMENHSVRTPDGGRRPSSFLILGVVNALEPKLGNLMAPFYRLNANEDSLIEVLGLNFDPDVELTKDVGATPGLGAGDADTAQFLPEIPVQAASAESSEATGL